MLERKNYTERISEYPLNLLNAKLYMCKMRLQDTGQKLTTRGEKKCWETIIRTTTGTHRAKESFEFYPIRV